MHWNQLQKPYWTQWHRTGGTNYEDVFKTTANFFKSDLATGKIPARPILTYFITDGQANLLPERPSRRTRTLYANVKFDRYRDGMTNYTHRYSRSAVNIDSNTHYLQH